MYFPPNSEKYFFSPFFDHLFIDILILHEKLIERTKLKIHNVMSWQSGGFKKAGCPGVHDLNPSGHLQQKSWTDS